MHTNMHSTNFTSCNPFSPRIAMTQELPFPPPRINKKERDPKILHKFSTGLQSCFGEAKEKRVFIHYYFFHSFIFSFVKLSIIMLLVVLCHWIFFFFSSPHFFFFPYRKDKNWKRVRDVLEIRTWNRISILK